MIHADTFKRRLMVTTGSWDMQGKRNRVLKDDEVVIDTGELWYVHVWEDVPQRLCHKIVSPRLGVVLVIEDDMEWREVE